MKKLKIVISILFLIRFKSMCVDCAINTDYSKLYIQVYVVAKTYPPSRKASFPITTNDNTNDSFTHSFVDISTHFTYLYGLPSHQMKCFILKNVKAITIYQKHFL